MAELISLGISVICHHFSACQCTSAPPLDWSGKKKKPTNQLMMTMANWVE
jgi:hypothetical protein